jgi:predicted amidophosphoribosyltransferase
MARLKRLCKRCINKFVPTGKKCFICDECNLRLKKHKETTRKYKEVYTSAVNITISNFLSLLKTEGSDSFTLEKIKKIQRNIIQRVK